MQLTIIGAGAIGGTIGAHLIRDGHDILLCDAAPATTPPVDTPEGELEGLFTAVFNITGDPALVLPCGWDADGLPIGIQLSAPRGADMQLLAAAALIETALAFDRGSSTVASSNAARSATIG